MHIPQKTQFYRSLISVYFRKKFGKFPKSQNEDISTLLSPILTPHLFVHCSSMKKSVTKESGGRSDPISCVIIYRTLVLNKAIDHSINVILGLKGFRPCRCCWIRGRRILVAPVEDRDPRRWRLRQLERRCHVPVPLFQEASSATPPGSIYQYGQDKTAHQPISCCGTVNLSDRVR